MKSALIFGISGQDGSYLAEHLLEEGFRVYGVIRRNSTPEHQHTRIETLKNVELFYGDLLDIPSINEVINKVKPTHIYNLAAQSHVRISFELPSFTTQVNSLGVLNLLSVIQSNLPDCKFYQASSSEMFGNSIDKDGYQRITTPMKPVSPYGCSKLYSYHLVRTYRESYKLFAINGILFNHESPRRGSNFVTNKIVKYAVKQFLSLNSNNEKLELGNIDAYRDWGHSYDYVRAIHKMMEYDEPRDWLISTGESKSVRYLCHYVFNALGLNYEDYVVENPKYFRPNELHFLKGDCTETKEILGWQPTYTFETLLDEMIKNWIEYYGKGE